MKKYQIRFGYTINHFREHQNHYISLLNSTHNYKVSDDYTDCFINSRVSNRTISIQSLQLKDIPQVLNDVPKDFVLIDIIEFPIVFRLTTTLYSFDSNLISKDLTTDQLEITKIANVNAEERNKYYEENIFTKSIFKHIIYTLNCQQLKSF